MHADACRRQNNFELLEIILENTVADHLKQKNSLKSPLERGVALKLASKLTGCMRM